MRRCRIARRDPREVAGDLAVEHEGIEAVSAPHVAPNVAGEVGRYRRQVDGRVATGAGTWPTAATDYVVVPEDQLIGIQQPDAERSGALNPVIVNPGRLSTERLAKDGLDARGHEPVAAEAQRRAGHRTAEVDADAMHAAAEEGGGDRNRCRRGVDAVGGCRPDAAPGHHEAEDRRSERR